MVFSTALSSVAVGAAASVPQLSLMNGQLVALGQHMTKALPFLGWAQEPLASTAIGGIGALPTAGPGNLTGSNVGAAAGTSWKTGFLSSLADFPALMVQAMTGGGGLTGAVQAMGSKIGSTLGSAASKLFSGTLGKAMGAILPGIGALLGPALGWISDKFLKTEGKKVNDLRDAFIGAAGGLNALNQKAVAAGTTLNALLNAKTVQDYETAVAALNTELERTAAIQGQIDTLQQQLNDRTVLNWEQAQQVIEKYGGTLANLGQTFVQAKEQASWKEVWDDWETLIDMGADIGGVLVSMQDEIQQLVQNSIAAGTAIPAQFQPLIQELIRTGQLFGANGEAITDLAGLKFGDPIVSEVDKIIAKIDELINTLNRGLAPGL